jgi:hypothetical protein
VSHDYTHSSTDDIPDPIETQHSSTSGNGNEIQSSASGSRTIFHSASRMLRKFSLGGLAIPLPLPLSSLMTPPRPSGAQPFPIVDDHSGGSNPGGDESIPQYSYHSQPPPQLQSSSSFSLTHRPSTGSGGGGATSALSSTSPKPTFVERSILQQDITRGQIIPSTFQPVTIIWNKRLDIKERNLIIHNYNTSGSAVHESLLLDNTALPNANGNVSISISTPKTSRSLTMASPVGGPGGGGGNGGVGNRTIPWSSIRQNLEEVSESRSGGGSTRII